jgi:23S rRNA (uracil1939-C5)-methyltransferase
MIPALIGLVENGLDPAPHETLFDFYAGVGLFSIALSGRYRQVVGVEAAEEAVECFQENIRENGLDNVTVVRGKVEGKTGDADRELEGKTVSVLVDPPREGMKREVTRFLNSAPLRKLVYVSCDPATMARDLRSLSTAYRLERITPLDMFPQTKHIEAVAVLKKNV